MQEHVYGRNAIQELIKSTPERINKILISSTVKKDKKINEIINQAKEEGVMFQFVPTQKLDTLCEGKPHQGLVASISPIIYADLDEFLDGLNKENAIIVILDGVEDPHNLGSIIRTAVCAGADGIIIPSRRSATVNATVQKASAGAVNHIPIIKVNNIVNAIEKLKEKFFWVFGADAHGEQNYYDVDYSGNCAIVLGGENCGISKLVGCKCDYLVRIPMLSDFNSLNVANAGSIVIYEVIKQRMVK
jgi:23S rRNA (guanosine2251-2'-O)-methyltransferase